MDLQEIKEIRLGGKVVRSMYLGDKKVYPYKSGAFYGKSNPNDYIYSLTNEFFANNPIFISNEMTGRKISIEFEFMSQENGEPYTWVHIFSGIAPIYEQGGYRDYLFAIFRPTGGHYPKYEVGCGNYWRFHFTDINNPQLYAVNKRLKLDLVERINVQNGSSLNINNTVVGTFSIYNVNNISPAIRLCPVIKYYKVIVSNLDGSMTRILVPAISKGMVGFWDKVNNVFIPANEGNVITNTNFHPLGD